MDNILEWLVPLIFAGIYFFGNMLSKKSDEEGAPTGRTADTDDEAIERQRRIQEDIRRKIMERRRAADGAQPELARDRSSPELPSRELAPDPPPRTVTPTNLGESTPANPYETKLQAQLKQIEATKRQAEKLKKQASERNSALRTAPTSKSQRQRGSRLSGPVRSVLTDPAAARAAFIYGEVIGPPISQRKTQTVPGLSQT